MKLTPECRVLAQHAAALVLGDKTCLSDHVPPCACSVDPLAVVSVPQPLRFHMLETPPSKVPSNNRPNVGAGVGATVGVLVSAAVGVAVGAVGQAVVGAAVGATVAVVGPSTAMATANHRAARIARCTGVRFAVAQGLMP